MGPMALKVENPCSGTVTEMSSPQAVEHVAVGEDTQHDVVRGGVMDEGPLGVDKEHVRHPDLLDQAAVERHALIGGAGEGQPLVLPVVSQVQCHGEVLGGHRERQKLSDKSSAAAK